MNLVGWVFDPEKDSFPSAEGTFLGIVEDFSQCHIGGTATLRPRPEVELGMQNAINDALSTGILKPQKANSMRGKLIHLTSSYEGRVGRGQTFAFQSHIEGPLHENVFEEIENNSMMLLELIHIKFYRTIGFFVKPRHRVTLYTDACCEPRPNEETQFMGLCYVVLDSPRFCNIRLAGKSSACACMSACLTTLMVVSRCVVAVTMSRGFIELTGDGAWEGQGWGR